MSVFKVGDKVYCPTYSKFIEVVGGDEYDRCYHLCVNGRTFTNCGREYDDNVSPSLLHATQENWELLSRLYPDVELEKPEAVGSDLMRQMLDDGAKEVLCWVSDVSDYVATQDKRIKVVISRGANDYFIDNARETWLFAVPIPRNYYAMDDKES